MAYKIKFGHHDSTTFFLLQREKCKSEGKEKICYLLEKRLISQSNSLPKLSNLYSLSVTHGNTLHCSFREKILNIYIGEYIREYYNCCNNIELKAIFNYKPPCFQFNSPFEHFFESKVTVS